MKQAHTPTLWDMIRAELVVMAADLDVQRLAWFSESPCLMDSPGEQRHRLLENDLLENFIAAEGDKLAPQARAALLRLRDSIYAYQQEVGMDPHPALTIDHPKWHDIIVQARAILRLMGGLGYPLKQFSQTEAKTDNKSYFFKGFPSVWNFLVLYMMLLGLNPWINFAMLVICNILVFVPVRFLYPTRNTRLRRFTLGFHLSVWSAWRLGVVAISRCA